MTRPTRTTSASDKERLFVLQTMLCERLDDLLDALGVKLLPARRFYFGACPIHGGRKSDAINLYHEGDTVPGIWRCNTHHCEETFRPTILGFVRGVLSHQEHGWSSPKDGNTVSFGDTVAWCCDFLGQPLATIKVDEKESEKRRFAATAAVLGGPATEKKPGISREQVCARLDIPSPYFVARGWSARVLKKYDVGDCLDATKPFYGRAVVPIYDEERRACIGCTGRSHFPQCPRCHLYHEGDCPPPDRAHWFPKWKNSDGFHRDATLYNWWFARQHIERDGLVALVESKGDLWRLEEAGIPYGLALMGSSLTDRQQVLLEKSGAMNVVILTNMDEPGRRAAAAIQKQIGRCFRIATPALTAKDLGEMEPAAARELLSPLFAKLGGKILEGY